MSTGYFPMPNAIVDDGIMANLSDKAFKAYVLVRRKTAGWQKPSDRISTSQFMDFAGIKKDETVYKVIKELVAAGLVSVSKDQGKISTYTLLDTPSHQTELPPSNGTTPNESDHLKGDHPHSMEQPLPSKGGTTTPIKRDSTKDNIKNTKQETNSLGDKPQKQPVQRTAKPTPNDEKAKSYTVQDLVDLGCDAQCAKDWLAIRTKKLTESALNRNISQASKVGLTLAEAVAWCAENAWQGFTANWYLNATKQPIATFSQKPASRSDGWDELFSQGDSDIRDVTPPKKYPPIEEVFHA